MCSPGRRVAWANRSPGKRGRHGCGRKVRPSTSSIGKNLLTSHAEQRPEYQATIRVAFRSSSLLRIHRSLFAQIKAVSSRYRSVSPGTHLGAIPIPQWPLLFDGLPSFPPLICALAHARGARHYATRGDPSPLLLSGMKKLCHKRLDFDCCLPWVRVLQPPHAKIVAPAGSHPRGRKCEVFSGVSVFRFQRPVVEVCYRLSGAMIRTS